MSLELILVGDGQSYGVIVNCPRSYILEIVGELSLYFSLQLKFMVTICLKCFVFRGKSQRSKATSEISIRDQQGDNSPGPAAADVAERLDAPPTSKATDVELEAVVPPLQLHASQLENHNVKWVGFLVFLPQNLFSNFVYLPISLILFYV